MHFSAGDPLEQNSHDSYGLQAAYARNAGWVSYVAGLDVELTEGELSEVKPKMTVGGKYAKGTHYNFEVEAEVISPYLHAVWSLSPPTSPPACAGK